MKEKTKRLPKTVFVFWKEYGDGSTSLVACESAGECLEGEIGEMRVGQYIVEDTLLVSASIMIANQAPAEVA